MRETKTAVGDVVRETMSAGEGLSHGITIAGRDLSNEWKAAGRSISDGANRELNKAELQLVEARASIGREVVRLRDSVSQQVRIGDQQNDQQQGARPAKPHRGEELAKGCLLAEKSWRKQNARLPEGYLLACHFVTTPSEGSNPPPFLTFFFSRS